VGCQTGQVSRLGQFRRPIRVICTLLAIGLVVWSYSVPSKTWGSVASATGIGVIVVVLLLPLITEFEVDVFGFRARGSLSTREKELQAACEQQAPRIASLLQLVGVDQDQIPALVQEAAKDTCRLWRGRVALDAVAQFVVCRAAKLVQLSLRLGGPYRIREPPQDRDDRGLTAFAQLDARERLIVAMVAWMELDENRVAIMLDVDLQRVLGVVQRWRTDETSGATA